LIIILALINTEHRKLSRPTTRADRIKTHINLSGKVKSGDDNIELFIVGKNANKANKIVEMFPILFEISFG